MISNIFRTKQYAIAKRYKQNQYKEKPDSSLANEDKHQCISVPEGIMIKCNHCEKAIYRNKLLTNNKICTECGAYFTASAIERLMMVLDEGGYVEYDKQLSTKDPLDFPGYNEKLIKAQSNTGLVDGLICAKGSIESIELMIGVMDASFFMGSMGTAIGEKLTRLFERATKLRLPVVIFTASGGARMQEGIFSLMQMAKVSGAVARHNEAGLLYITVLTHPTTGGVTASFAMLGDIILAEPKALIGFAGPRVIEQTIGQKLPAGFQRAEFLLEHGFVDKIVKREELRKTLGLILRIHHHN